MKSLEQIASALQGYDPQALSAQQVADFLRHLAPTADASDVQTCAVADALERIVAQDIVSSVNVPAHDNSAMDGYALDGAVLATGGEIRLRCVGTALAGSAWQGTAPAGTCVQIMTGAVMPPGLNTVVPAEFTRVEGEQVVFAATSVRPGDNRRECGEDIRLGQVALPQGTRLGPAALGLLASLGIPTVQVYPRLRVAYFSTGSEILSLGDAPREGAVYDSNRYTINGMLQRLGCEVIDMGVVRDDPKLIEQAFAFVDRQTKNVGIQAPPQKQCFLPGSRMRAENRMFSTGCFANIGHHLEALALQQRFLGGFLLVDAHHLRHQLLQGRRRRPAQFQPRLRRVTER